jgi:RsiW-degrading membrane proteinase PrsW (M82 family)
VTVEFDDLAMAILIAVPHFVTLASVLHLFAEQQTTKARSRLEASALLASYAPTMLLLWFVFPENPYFSFAVFLVLFSLGPIFALFALGFFLAARIGAGGGRKWDILSMCIAAVIGVMTYYWASSSPAG